MRKLSSKNITYYGLNMKICVVITTILALCLITPSQIPIQIDGRVIDGNQNPVVKAQIQLFPADCNECPLDVVETFTSNENGYFTARLLSKTKYHLFIEEEVPSTYWKAINFPSGTIRYLPRYRGKFVYFRNLPEKTLLELQNLKPTVEYVKTEISLDKFNIKQYAGVSGYSDIKIQTRDYKGKIVTDRRYIDEKYWTDSSRIKVTLPRGLWTLDIFNVENEKEYKIGTIKMQLEDTSKVKQIYNTEDINIP